MWTIVVDIDNPNWIKEKTLFTRILIKIGIIEVIERKFESPPKNIEEFKENFKDGIGGVLDRTIKENDSDKDGD